MEGWRLRVELGKGEGLEEETGEGSVLGGVMS